MNYLKSHITLIAALISILISVFLFETFSQISKSYEKNIINNYSIVIVSTKQIASLNLPQISSITAINISKVLQKMKKEYPNINFSDINLPFFYKIRLKHYPSPSELKSFTEQLKKLPYIKRLLTHSNAQTKIYNLLMLLKIVTKTFMFLTAVLGFLLILKQLEVWKLSHSERMYIMELFGAPFWLKGAVLFKIAITDSIIAIAISLFLIYFILHSAIFIQIINELGIIFNFNYFKEAAKLFGISFSISLISSFLVVTAKK